MAYQQISRGSGNPQRDLNHMAPAANTVHLGDLINDIITAVNLQIAQSTALLAALVAASGADVPSLTTVSALTAPTAVRTLTTPYSPEIPLDYPSGL